MGEGRGEGRISTDDAVAQAGAAILDFISSDATLDRYGEIITPAGWHLDTYRRNPVFQNAHNYGDIMFTLGRALITELRSSPPPHSLSSSGGEGRGEEARTLSTRNPQPSTYLFQRIQFAVDTNPIAKIAYGLYKGHFLNAVSVGFIPLRWQDHPASSLAAPEHSEGGSSSLTPAASAPEPSPVGPAAPERVEGAPDPTAAVPARPPAGHPLPSDGRGVRGEGCAVTGEGSGQIRGEGPRRIYVEQELLEVSAVSIPANPNALALALKSGALEKSDLQDTADLINYTLSAAHASLSRQSEAAAERSTLHAPHAPPADLAPLLALARQIRAQLKHL
jgi:hypothetical protein